MTKSICGGGNYEIGGPREDTITMPVSFLKLPETIEIEGQTLSRKSLFHTSLVCIGKIIEKHKVEIADFQEKVMADFCEFTQNNPVEIVRFRDEYKFVIQNERHSVVVMCDVSNLDKFFDLINGKYSLNLEYPPTHVTLYTLQLDKGIFLTDSKDIETMTKPIKNPGIKLDWKKF